MNGEEEILREAIHDRFKSATEFAPNEIRFHTWEQMRKLQGVGKELKEQKVKDNRENLKP